MRIVPLAVCIVLFVSPGRALATPPLLQQWPVSNPETLYMGPADNLYVIHNGDLTKYSREGTALGNWPGRLVDVAVASNGEMFLLQAHNYADQGEVHRVQADGTVIAEWETKVRAEENDSRNSGIAVSNEGTVFVVSESFRRVVKFSPDGEYLHHWSTQSASSGPSVPTRIVLDGDGNVVIGDFSDARIGRIKTYTPNGERIGSWTDILPDGKSFYPSDIALDRWDNIYIADAVHNMILVYDRRGNPLGTYRPADGEYFSLEGVAVDSQGNSYAADDDDDRILKFAPFGPAFAPVEDAAVMLHVRPAGENPDPCSGAPRSVADIVTEGQGDPAVGGSYYIYVLGSPTRYMNSQSGGINGFQFGIDYHKTGGQSEQAIRIHEWTQCAGLEFPQDSWPDPHSGNTITWPIGECQPQEIVSAGYFYLSAYSPSRMSVVSFPPTGEVKVANCFGAEMAAQAPLSPIRLGWVVLEETGGCNPLLEPCYSPTAVEKETWGGLKTRYKAGSPR